MTGNYSDLPLYVGMRRGTILPFKGRFYSYLIIGGALTDAEIEVCTAYVNSKTGAY